MTTEMLVADTSAVGLAAGVAGIAGAVAPSAQAASTVGRSIRGTLRIMGRISVGWVSALRAANAGTWLSTKRKIPAKGTSRAADSLKRSRTGSIVEPRLARRRYR